MPRVLTRGSGSHRCKDGPYGQLLSDSRDVCVHYAHPFHAAFIIRVLSSVIKISSSFRYIHIGSLIMSGYYSVFYSWTIWGRLSNTSPGDKGSVAAEC